MEVEISIILLFQEGLCGRTAWLTFSDVTVLYP